MVEVKEKYLKTKYRPACLMLTLPSISNLNYNSNLDITKMILL
jgi:hypothetical protein